MGAGELVVRGRSFAGLVLSLRTPAAPRERENRCSDVRRRLAACNARLVNRQSLAIAADAVHCPSRCDRRGRRASRRTQKTMEGAAAAAAIVSRRAPVTPSPPYSILLPCTPGLTPLRHPTRLILLSSPRFLKPTITSARRRMPLGEIHPRAALLRDTGATAAVMGGAYLLVRAFDVLTDGNVIEQVRPLSLSLSLTCTPAGRFLILRTALPLSDLRRLLASFSGRKSESNRIASGLSASGHETTTSMVEAVSDLHQTKEDIDYKETYGRYITQSRRITSTEARYFAAVVPLVNCLRLLIYGLSIASDEGLVKSVTRDGKPEELLRGPLYYVLVLMFCALIFWRESPVGVVALGLMSGGDGFADIMGRRFGAIKLPYNQAKSLLDWESTVKKVAIISLVATLVESLPITQFVDDNISVPLASMMMAALFFSPGSPL
ncbi:hypothetical protein ACLOJK_020904 [Asimina triloba]